MSLDETIKDLKRQAELQAEKNLSEQSSSNPEQLPPSVSTSSQPSETDSKKLSLTISDLQQIIEREVAGAIAKLSKDKPPIESKLETKLDETSHQLNQFRSQQNQTNNSLKQQMESLRKETKDSFDGLSDLIQEKMKPLDEINARMLKQLPPKKEAPKLPPVPRQSTGSSSRKTNISENSNRNYNQNYSIDHPAVTYYPSTSPEPVSHPTPRRRAEPVYQEPELPGWVQMVQSIMVPFEIMLWLIYQAFRITGKIISGLFVFLMIFPEVIPFLFLVITAISIVAFLYWGISYMLSEIPNPFHRTH